MNHILSIMRALVCAAVVATLPAQPDLSAIYCSASPSMGLLPGQQFVVNYDVQNVGSFGTAPLWGDRVLWSNVPGLPATPLWTQCRNLPLFVGQTYSQFSANFPLTVAVPAGTAPGTYWVGYQINFTLSQQGPCTPAGWPVPEVNYGNNIVWTQVTVAGPPSYRINNVAVSQPWASPATTVDVTFDITNNGGPIGPGSVAAAVFLSTSGTPSGPVLAMGPYVTVAPGTTLPVTISSVPVPNVPYGAYQMVVDCAYYGGPQGACIGSAQFTIAPSASVTPFGTGCGGPMYEPILTALDPPLLGQQHHIQIDTPVPLTPVFVFNGLARFQPPGDLGQLGMTGCFAYVEPLNNALMISQSTSQVHTIGLPSSPAFLGVEVLTQVVSWVGGPNSVNSPNPAGLVTSAALASTIGL